MWSLSVMATSHATIQANWSQDADLAFCFLRLTALNRVFSGIHFSLIRSSSRNCGRFLTLALVQAKSLKLHLSWGGCIFYSITDLQFLLTEYNLCPCHTEVTSCNSYNLRNYAWSRSKWLLSRGWALLFLPLWPSDSLSRKNGTPADLLTALTCWWRRHSSLRAYNARTWHFIIRRC